MLPRALLIAGLVATVVGAALLILFPWQQTAFGWFAYSPLSSRTYIPPAPLSGTAVAAIVVLAAAVPLLAGGAILWLTRQLPRIQHRVRSET